MLRKIIPGLLCLLVAGLALAQPKSETKHVTGAVKSIAADSMVVTVNAKDWTFLVDKDTHVVAKGASHSRSAEGASNPRSAEGASNPRSAEGASNPRSAEGASNPRSAEGASNPRKATMITDFVKAGQTVTVDYNEIGGKFTAKQVRVK